MSEICLSKLNIIYKYLNFISKCLKTTWKRCSQKLKDGRPPSSPGNTTPTPPPPFTFVGVDCFGPFMIKRARSLVKRYGVLFTCMTIRAIHLEVAYCLDTDSFLHAMRRFIACIGPPEVMRSNNGGNFISGEKELRAAVAAWNQQKIHQILLQRNVKWVFNPPAGSHYGGVWERCIRTVRKVMAALLNSKWERASILASNIYFAS